MQVSSKEACVQNLQMFKRPFLGYNDEKGNCLSDLENFGNGPSACGHEKGASIVGKALVRVCACVRMRVPCRKVSYASPETAEKV
jgi:hypothetical protein